MELPTPSARYLGTADRGALRGFSCSSGEWFADEVEAHVRHRLLDRHLARTTLTDHRLIGLELPDRGLVAVAAHEEDLTRAGGRDLTSTLWVVAAVAADLRGATLSGVDFGERRSVTLGRYLAEVVLSDVAETTRAPYVRAVVARENARSLALCRRVGLTREMSYPDARYVALLGVMP